MSRRDSCAEAKVAEKRSGQRKESRGKSESEKPLDLKKWTVERIWVRDSGEGVLVLVWGLMIPRVFRFKIQRLGIHRLSGGPAVYKGKIPRDLTEASLPGAGLSIIAAFSMIFLFGMELNNYFTVSTSTSVIVDKSSDGEFLRIDFNFRSGVHHALNPDPYSGVFGSDREKYARDVEDLITFGTPGHVAGFIFEAIYGVGGIIELAPGYFPAVYSSIKKVGGLCIADEVQSGFAHTGSHFWGFETQGIVPDIVTMAKPSKRDSWEANMFMEIEGDGGACISSTGSGSRSRFASGTS
ncbi:unnamed protein product [Camellia sinensis]